MLEGLNRRLLQSSIGVGLPTFNHQPGAFSFQMLALYPSGGYLRLSPLSKPEGRGSYTLVVGTG